MNKEFVIGYFIVGLFHAMFVLLNDERNVFKFSHVVLTVLAWPILTFIALKEMIKTILEY